MRITVARIVCSWCDWLMAVEYWPYDPEYGDTTVSHGMCKKCFSAIDIESG